MDKVSGKLTVYFEKPIFRLLVSLKALKDLKVTEKLK